jgi:hypothetical protein
MIVSIAMMVAACGGGGSGGATSGTIDPKVADQLAANAAVLQASDLPGLFSSHSSSSSSSTDTAPRSDADRCFTPAADQSSSALDQDVTAKADREYAIGFRLDTVIVGGRVEMYRDATGPSSKLATYGQPAVTDCLKKLYVDQLTAVGATVGDVTITPSKIEGVGDEQGGFLLSFVATIDGVVHPFAIEFDFTRVRRVGLTVSVFSPRGPDHSLTVTAMKAMVARLSQ